MAKYNKLNTAAGHICSSKRSADVSSCHSKRSDPTTYTTRYPTSCKLATTNGHQTLPLSTFRSPCSPSQTPNTITGGTSQSPNVKMPSAIPQKVTEYRDKSNSRAPIEAVLPTATKSFAGAKWYLKWPTNANTASIPSTIGPTIRTRSANSARLRTIARKVNTRTPQNSNPSFFDHAAMPAATPANSAAPRPARV